MTARWEPTPEDVRETRRNVVAWTLIALLMLVAIAYAAQESMEAEATPGPIVATAGDHPMNPAPGITNAQIREHLDCVQRLEDNTKPAPCRWCEPGPTTPGVSHTICPECAHIMSVAADKDEGDRELVMRAVRAYGSARAKASAEGGEVAWDRSERAYLRIWNLVHRLVEDMERGRTTNHTKGA